VVSVAFWNAAPGVCPGSPTPRTYDGVMASPRSLALVSDDLMFASQLQAAMKRLGGSCALVVGATVPVADAVFVDLNRNAEERLALIAELRAAHPQLQIVGFCHHGERELRRRALASGATRVINNGALQVVAMRLAGLDVGNRP
jgi:DNA-binding NarL/FixJ family response regulator